MAKLRFLLLEDSNLDAGLIQVALEKADIQCELVQVQTQAKFLAALQSLQLDLILSDYRLSGFDGIAALDLARTHCPTTPFIFVSASLGEEMAIDLLKRGATDYVLKERLVRLPAAVQRALREAQDQRDRQAALAAQQQAELALQQNQARLLLCVEAANLGLWDYNPNTDTGYLSDRCKTMFDLPFDATLTYTQFLERLHPDDRQHVYEAVKRAILHQDPYDIEFRICWGNGTIRWIHAKGQTHHNAEGKPIWMGGVGIDITERKQSEERLRQSDLRFRRLVMSNVIGCMFWDTEGRILDANDAFLQTVGYSRAELEAGQLNWQAMTPSEQLSDSHDSIATMQNIGTAPPLEKEYIRKDGSRVPVLLGGVMFEDVQDRGVSFVLDLSDRKQAESALRQSEERFRTLTNAMPQLVWVNDAAGNTTYLNDPWEDYLGLPIETIVSTSRSEFTHPDDFPNMVETRNSGIAAGAAYKLEARLRRVDGQYRWHLIRVVPLKDAQGQITSWYGTATDIDDVKQVEAGQRFLAQVSGILAQSLDYPITLSRIAQLAVPFLADYCFFDILAADQQLQRVAWYHIAPQKHDQISDTLAFVPPLTFTQHPICKAVLRSEISFVPEVTDEWLETIALNPAHLAFLRSLQLRSCITVPLSAHGRKLGALMLCFTAESERRHTEANLQLAQELAHRAATALDNAQLYQQAQEANRIKDEFLAVLSHELRTPLNPILGWAKLLRSNLSDPIAVTKGLEAIERNAKIQTQLIEDLLDISQILRGKLSLSTTPIYLSTIIEAASETVQLAAEAKSLQIDRQIERVGQVVGDPGRLQQVVWNLLSNAVKFTPAGGRVTISLRQVGSQAQIQVTDTGKGITPEFLPHVFERFRQEDGTTTRKFGGLGLGLAIVRYLVEMHGGTVQAESGGEGQGATFTVQLPLQSAVSLASPQDDRQADSVNLSNLSILVVEDDLDTLEFLKFLLEQQGAAIITAITAAEALQVLAHSQPDLLVTDIGMPEMDGYMLLQRIRASNQNQHIPAIALTAYASELDQQRALRMGFQRHLTKPIDPLSLITTIAELVGIAAP
ncbi:PAS domain S-box protein [Phormidium tenue FACHB-886]|nr:PAS domain S-box protein [Phormidium tenue FACHB-886]